MDENNIKTEPLASEMYEDLKKATRFREKIIYILLIVVGVLVIALMATNIYHIRQWSQFDTIVVDSGEGNGNANLVQGDVGGDILNGENRGEDTQDGTVERNESTRPS